MTDRHHWLQFVLRVLLCIHVQNVNVDHALLHITMSDSALINLSSADGAKLLTDVQTGLHGSCCQSKLVDIFTKQLSRTSCGLVSCGLVMSAYHRNETASTQSMTFTEQNMFNMPATLSVISKEKMDKDGNE